MEKVEITFTVTKNGEKETVKIKALSVHEAWASLPEKVFMEDVEKIVLTTHRCL